MKKKISALVLFICSMLALLISLKLFWNMGIYVDKYGTSPSNVYGSEFWLYMAWLRLALLGIVTYMLGYKLFHN